MRGSTGSSYSGSQKNYGSFLNIFCDYVSEMLEIVDVASNFMFCRYEMQDLHVSETLPQMVALSEAYMQIYEQQQ